MTTETPVKKPVWTPTKVQSLYRHQNGRYYARTFAGGKEKWTSLRTTVLSVAKNLIQEHLDANERRKVSGEAQRDVGRLTFGDALTRYREHLGFEGIRPKTREFREAGIKLVLRSWPGIEEVNTRKITARAVEEWLRRFYSQAKPHVPKNAKSPAKNSTGASTTTIKCALDAMRYVLDVAVDAGFLYANPARNPSVADGAKKILKAVRRKRAEKGGVILPDKENFSALANSIRKMGFGECEASADYVEFIAFSGARKNEAINVLWSDVDFPKGKIHLRVTKNGEARFVPMLAEMRDLLTKMKKRGRNAASTDAVLLVREAGGFITRASRERKIPRFTTHGLRHLFGTACMEAGVDVRTVAKWMGHKDNGALLLKIHAHVRGDHETAMAKKVIFAKTTASEVKASES